MKTETPGHVRKAWLVFKGRPGAFVGAAVVIFLLWALLEVLVITLHETGVIFNVALHLVFMLLIAGAMAGLHGMALAGLAGDSVSLADLTRWLPRGPQFLAAAVLYVLLVAVGLVLLIVPGVFLAVRFGLFPQVVATTQAGPLEALRLAGRLTAGRWAHVAGVLARALLVTLAGAALLGVGAFVTFPLAVIACSSLYRSLNAER